MNFIRLTKSKIIDFDNICSVKKTRDYFDNPCIKIKMVNGSKHKVKIPESQKCDLKDAFHILEICAESEQEHSYKELLCAYLKDQSCGQ